MLDKKNFSKLCFNSIFFSHINFYSFEEKGLLFTICILIINETKDGKKKI